MQEIFRMELTGLTGDTEYEVRLRAMNSQGWSQLSNPFQFRTAGNVIAEIIEEIKPLELLKIRNNTTVFCRQYLPASPRYLPGRSAACLLPPEQTDRLSTAHPRHTCKTGNLKSDCRYWYPIPTFLTIWRASEDDCGHFYMIYHLNNPMHAASGGQAYLTI